MELPVELHQLLYLKIALVVELHVHVGGPRFLWFDSDLPVSDTLIFYANYYP